MQEFISDKVKTGSFWSFTAHFTSKVLSLGVGVVLARILRPEDFGIIAVAMVVWEFVVVFGSTGISSKIIHQEQNIARYATAGFWLNIIVAVILSLAAIAIAPFAAALYASTLIKPIIYILATSFVMAAFGSTHATLLTKEMAFKRLAILNLSVEILRSLISLIMVLTGYGIWSLVIPNLLVTPVRVICLWMLHPWRPSLRLEREYWKDIFNFGKYVFGTSILRYININGDFMIIGKLLGVQALGLYNFGYSLANWPIGNFVWVANRVMLPAFSKLQDNLNAMRELYLKCVEVVSLVAFPCIIGLIAVADDLIPVVYGAKWIPSILPLKLIAAFTLIRSVGTIGGQILLALGKPSKEFSFNAKQAVPLVVAIIIGAQYGIVGVAASMSLVLATFAIFFIKIAADSIELTLLTVVRTVLPAFMSSTIMWVSVATLSLGLHTLGYEQIYILLASIGCGISVYLFALGLFFRDTIRRLLNVFAVIIWEFPAFIKIREKIRPEVASN